VLILCNKEDRVLERVIGKSLHGVKKAHDRNDRAIKTVKTIIFLEKTRSLAV
jgi:hypothetical protein